MVHMDFHLLGKEGFDSVYTSVFGPGVLSRGEKEGRMPWAGVSGMLVIYKAG